MKKEFLRHALFLFLFLALLSVVKRWWGLSFWPLWLGGILGIITPEADHLIYVFFISPQEVTSQRVIHLLKNKDFRSALNLLYDTRNERQDLIFHSNLALITFLIFGFWVLTSSGNLLEIGLVLGFIIHLLLDRIKSPLYHRTS